MVTLGENGPPEEVPVTPRFDVAYDEASSGTLIGQGGNADVYKITVERPDQAIPLAIKQPRIQQTLTKDVVERFNEETRVWESLDSHDYIVNIVDADDTPIPWIAMEYMDGGSLRSLISEEQLPFSQAVWVGLCVTRAVRHAHRHGVAHHDIKPANVLFRRSETGWMVPKVSDWGLARMMLEETNSVAGLSPQYAAPEQFDADTFGSPDDQTDIYQLGVLLYELFTGKPPFDGTAAAVMQDVLTEQPDPPSSIAQVPAPVDELIMPALEKSKSDRYDSTVYLRDGLKQLYQSPENVDSGISKPIFHDQQPEHASETAEIGVETNEIGTQGDPRSSENDSSRRHLMKYLGFLGIITGGTGLGAWGAFADFSTTSSEESTDGDDTYVGSNEQVVDSGNDANNNDETTDNAEHTASRDSEPTVESSQSDDVTVLSSTRERMVENVPEEINNYLNDGDATFYRGTIADYTGQDEVTIYVGMIDVFGFQPPALRVDAGTTVVWEWTGEGGSHNIVSEPSSTIQFNSGDPVNEAGHTFEMTFNEPNIHLYYCTAHRVDGEIGAIDVV